MEKGKIIIDNYIPSPPDAKGNWRGKSRDHNSFQLKVSLAAQLGGTSAGCPTPEAETARQKAEDRYFDGQKISPKKILLKK